MDSQSDQLFGAANALLSCDHHFARLSRSGPITVLPSVINGQVFDGIVTSWSTLTDLVGVPGNIKVVKEIDVCVNPQGIPIPGDFVGCVPVMSPRSKPNIVVAYSSTIEAGMVLAHEYCHTQGLAHRDDSGALMSPNFTGDSKALSADECKMLYP